MASKLHDACRVGGIAGLGALAIQTGAIGKVGNLFDHASQLTTLGPGLAIRMTGAARLADGLASRKTEYSAKFLKNVLTDMSRAQRKLRVASEEQVGYGNTGVRTLECLKRIVNRYQLSRMEKRQEIIKEAYLKKRREETQKSLNHAFQVFGVVGASAVVGISVATSLAKYIKSKNSSRAYTEVASSLGETVESAPQPLVLPAVDHKLEQLLPSNGKFDKADALTRLSVDPAMCNELMALLTSGIDGDEHKREKEQFDVLIEKLFSKPFDCRDGDMRKYGQPLGPTTTLAYTKRRYLKSPEKTLYCVEGCDNLIRMFTSRADEDKIWQKMWDSFMRDSRLNLDTQNRLRSAHGTVNRALWIVQHSQPATRPLGAIVTDELQKALPVAADLYKATRGVCEIDKNTTDYKFADLGKYAQTAIGAICVAGLRYGVRGVRALRPIKENF